jgi:hypothetical protein
VFLFRWWHNVPKWRTLMRLVGISRLDNIKGINREVDTWLSAWVEEMSHASWRGEVELMDAFPRIDLLEADLFFFPVFGHNDIGIKVSFYFEGGIAVINEVIKK